MKPGSICDTVVIGAGASGTLVAAQFHRLAPRARLALVGDAPRPARGVAYETRYRANLLNVPAGKMSALPHDPDHFLHWLRQRQPEAGPDTFAPRRVYGDYLTGIFEEAMSGPGTVEYVPDAAVGLTRRAGAWSVELASGRSIEAGRAVLAFGNLQVPGDPIDFAAVAPNYRRNPWARDAVEDLDPGAPVLLIGSGLTMADVALSLREDGHRGPLHVLSRHGRLYQAHRAHAYAARPLATLPPDFASPAGAMRWIRRESALASAAGSDWQAVIDSLRPHTATVWKGWDLAQRKTFLRHGRNLWDTHRHRMAPEVARQLTALLDEGAMTLHRGHLVAAEREGAAAVVSWRDPGGEVRRRRVARIVNCSGPSRDYSFNRSPLIAQLRASGLLVPDALRLGFDTDEVGRFRGADGEPVAGLFTLGPVRIPTLWESVAMPEIATQALELATTLTAETGETAER